MTLAAIKARTVSSGALLYKPDWDDAKDRMAAWWEGDRLDRPPIQVLAPRDPTRATWVGFDNWMLAKSPEHPDAAVDEFERWCPQVHFGGEAYPNFWINLGAGVIGAYLGAEPKFEADSIWFGAQWSNDYVKDWRELSDVQFDDGSKWWNLTRSITQRATERSKGRFIVGTTDLGGIADIIASLRGPKNLLVDLHTNPAEVKRLSERIVNIWHRCYDYLDSTIRHECGGSSAWMGIWSPLKWYPLQCDFAAMLSPGKFDEFVLPYLKDQCQRLDHPLYHLDGPGQICHLNSLLSIPELRGIQWVPGAGEDSVGDHCGSEKWSPLYEKILESGKNIVMALPPAFIEPIIKKFRSTRMLFQTLTSSETEANSLLRRAEELFA